VIVETIVDSEFAVPARRRIQLKKHGFTLDSNHGGELPQPANRAACMAFEI